MRGAVGVALGRAVVLGLLLCGAVTESRAALDQPDALVYGRVLASGEPAANGVVIKARSGLVEIDSFTLGSGAAGPGFYALRIPTLQSTEAGETPPDGTVFSGSAVSIFVGPRAAGAVVAQSGKITRDDLNAGLSLCTGGSGDGEACMLDGDCPGGLCVLAQALCDGGGDDGMSCQCIGAICGAEPACATNAAMGTCNGGALAGECCDVSMNCGDGAACTGSQRVCEAGSNKGFPCLRDAHCPGSRCVSTGKVCNGGANHGFSCVDAADCGGGICGDRIVPTATPTRTPTSVTGGPGPSATPSPSPTPTPSPMPGGCAGDCDGSHDVTINELITLVNVALGLRDVSSCVAGDVSSDGTITIEELIRAVNNALNGC